MFDRMSRLVRSWRSLFGLRRQRRQSQGDGSPLPPSSAPGTVQRSAENELATGFARQVARRHRAGTVQRSMRRAQNVAISQGRPLAHYVMPSPMRDVSPPSLPLVGAREPLAEPETEGVGEIGGDAAWNALWALRGKGSLAGQAASAAASLPERPATAPSPDRARGGAPPSSTAQAAALPGRTERRASPRDAPATAVPPMRAAGRQAPRPAPRARPPTRAVQRSPQAPPPASEAVRPGRIEEQAPSAPQPPPSSAEPSGPVRPSRPIEWRGRRPPQAARPHVDQRGPTPPRQPTVQRSTESPPPEPLALELEPSGSQQPAEHPPLPPPTAAEQPPPAPAQAGLQLNKGRAQPPAEGPAPPDGPPAVQRDAAPEPPTRRPAEEQSALDAVPPTPTQPIAGQSAEAVQAAPEEPTQEVAPGLGVPDRIADESKPPPSIAQAPPTTVQRAAEAETPVRTTPAERPSPQVPPTGTSGEAEIPTLVPASPQVDPVERRAPADERLLPELPGIEPPGASEAGSVQASSPSVDTAGQGGLLAAIRRRLPLRRRERARPQRRRSAGRSESAASIQREPAPEPPPAPAPPAVQAEARGPTPTAPQVGEQRVPPIEATPRARLQPEPSAPVVPPSIAQAPRADVQREPVATPAQPPSKLPVAVSWTEPNQPASPPLPLTQLGRGAIQRAADRHRAPTVSRPRSGGQIAPPAATGQAVPVLEPATVPGDVGPTATPRAPLPLQRAVAPAQPAWQQPAAGGTERVIQRTIRDAGDLRRALQPAIVPSIVQAAAAAEGAPAEGGDQEQGESTDQSLETMAEKVYHILRRRLAIERERERTWR